MGDVFRTQWRRKDGRSGISRKWYGEYRDDVGKLRRVPLATDRQVARVMLADLVRRAERRKAGIADDATEAAGAPLGGLIDAYLADLALRGRDERYRRNTNRLIRKVVEACWWETPGQMDAGKLDVFLADLKCSARTKATYRQAVVGFANWLVRKRKLPTNPLVASTHPAGEATRQRRALTIDELRRLIAAAGERPLNEARLVRRGQHKGEMSGRVAPEVEAELQRRGHHNALLYRTAFYTGLRADELRALRANNLVLTGENPRLFLSRDRTKNKQDAVLPLRADLAADLRAWMEGHAIGSDDLVFSIPRDAARLVRRDLAAAGIPYRDARGRVADFHALRTSLATHLNAAGVPATTAKGLLRHSTITLTANIYHDHSMDDGRGAVEGLPGI